MAASTSARKPRTTAAKAEELKISTVGDFKKRISAVVELPSGAVVKLKNPGGLRVFMGKGKIPNSLLPIISQALDRGTTEGMGEELAQKLKDGDTELLDDMNQMMDSVTLMAVVEPPILPVPTQADVEENNRRFPEAPVEDPEDLRSEDLLYVDEFPDEDKQFIFAWITSGVKDLETFRAQQRAGVDSLSAMHGTEDAAIG